MEGQGLKLEEVLEILDDPDVRYTTSPESLMKYADFMATVGSIKARPQRVAGHVLPRHPRRARQLRAQQHPRAPQQSAHFDLFRFRTLQQSGAHCRPEAGLSATVLRGSGFARSV